MHVISLFLQSWIKLMQDSGLRCLNCVGKLGPLIGDLRCEFCCLVFRLQDLVVSDRFPAAGVRFVTPELRTAYHRALEVADSYLHAGQGDKGSPRVGDKGAAPEEAPGLSTTPKAKPAVKVEAVEEASSSRPKEEEKSPEEGEKPKESKEEKKARKKEKKRREREQGGTLEPAASVRRSPSRRSRSRERRRSREALPRIRRGDKEHSPDRRVSPERIERRPRSEEGRRGGAEASAPLRPRSPPGPPPPRPAGHGRWEGPIPSYHNRPRDPERREHREPRNKGAKKRRQQALFSEFKAWRKNRRGHPHY